MGASLLWEVRFPAKGVDLGLQKSSAGARMPEAQEQPVGKGLCPLPFHKGVCPLPCPRHYSRGCTVTGEQIDGRTCPRRRPS